MRNRALRCLAVLLVMVPFAQFDPGASLVSASGGAVPAPSSVTAERNGSQSVLVTWTEVVGVDGYLVTPVATINGAPTELASVLVASSARGYPFDNLVNGTTYTFRVRALLSPASSLPKESLPITPAGAPSQPSGLQITPGDGSLTVRWQASDPNGDPLQGYTVELLQGVSVLQTGSTSSAVMSFSNLINETSYQVKVTATNGVGSTPSEPQSGTPTAGVAPPTNVQATAGSGRVTLSWTPATQLGGEAIDEYVVEVSPTVSAGPIDGSLSTFDVTGLTAGVPYTFRLRTVTVTGKQSAFSVAVQATPTSGTGTGTGTGGGGGGSTEDESSARAGRIGGTDRYHTAVLLSQSYFSPGVPVVYLASGEGFADALAGGPATKGDGPVLLVRKSTIPTDVAAELDRLNPGRIVILGGESVVSAAVLESARAFTTGTVTRIGGSDRYATSALLSASRFSPGVAVAFLATGLGFADALAAAPLGAPVLLSRTTCVPRVVLDEIARLNPTAIFVLGGQSALNAPVRNLAPC